MLEHIINSAGTIIGSIVLLVLLFNSIITIPQGYIGIITRFGKFQKTANAGLNFKVPFIDTVSSKVSLQNRSTEIKFQAITKDQASVTFNAMLIYSALNSEEETIKNIVFKFRTDAEFVSALMRSIEGEVRGFVATKLQSQILSLRNEIIEHVKSELDKTLGEWGYHLSSLQINDIAFSKTITDSMELLVSSANLKTAAENEGQALLIRKTKQAEAEGNAIKISAEAEKEAAILRGQGIAKFREEVAKGLKQAAQELGDDTATAMSAIMFSTYMENMKEMAVNSTGNIFFFDGSVDNYARTMKQMSSLTSLVPGNKSGGKPENKG